MAKLYFTREIVFEIEDMIKQNTLAVINDKSLSVEEVIRHVCELRIFKKYADELVGRLKELDRLEDEEIKAYEARQAAKKAATETAAKADAEKHTPTGEDDVGRAD